MVRENPDGTGTPLTMPNHLRIKTATLRIICTQATISRVDFLQAYDRTWQLRRGAGPGDYPPRHKLTAVGAALPEPGTWCLLVEVTTPRHLNPIHRKRLSLFSILNFAPRVPFKSRSLVVAATLLLILTACFGLSEADKHYNSGVDLLKEGRFQEALAEFDQALLLDGSLAAAFHNRALAKEYTGRIPEAI